MPIFLTYIRNYLKTVHTGLLISVILFTALLVFCNYRFCIEQRIVQTSPNRFTRFAAFYCVYLFAFATPYLMTWLLKGEQLTEWKPLLLLILLSPAIFALKVSFNGFSLPVHGTMNSVWERYWAITTRLPFKCLLVVIPLAFIWWKGKYEPDFFGALTGNINWKPYFFMLLLMAPLIAWASTQSGFLHVYPKMQQVAFIEAHTPKPWLYKLLFELSYGIDFITIELFFRGFLVLAFARFVSRDAILPMAVFYCSIHFGKPLAECMSSFFGGLLLGIIVYNTRSIAGGLIVHLGIAWMMEAGGYLGNIVKYKTH